MRKTWKILSLSVVALCLTTSLSSCGYNGKRIDYFLNDVSSVLSSGGMEYSWDGIKYEYTESSFLKSKSSYGKSKERDTYSDTITFKNNSKNELTATEHYKESYKCRNNSGGSTISRNEVVYVSGKKAYYRSKVNGNKEYTTRSNYSSFSSILSGYRSDISTEISRYLRGYYYVTYASSGTNSAHWTYTNSGGEEKTTVCIRTNGQHVPIYFSIEYFYSGRNSSRRERYRYKEVYRKTSGGTISKPSWVNKRNFPGYEK